MLFRQPKGGLTKYDGDDGMQEDNYLLAQVPVYGTRDAGKLWEDIYTLALEGMGFVTGVSSNPCVFHHQERDISIAVHGDDFTALATDEHLDWYENELRKHFEIQQFYNISYQETLSRVIYF